MNNRAVSSAESVNIECFAAVFCRDFISAVSKYDGRGRRTFDQNRDGVDGDARAARNACRNSVKVAFRLRVPIGRQRIIYRRVRIPDDPAVRAVRRC